MLQLLRDLRDIKGMIPQTLKFRDGGEIIIHDLHMVLEGDGGGDLNQVIAHMIRHGVNIIFILLNLFHNFRIILGKQVKRAADVGSCQMITVDVKDNMFLTRLTVTDNDETLVDMSESELAENGGIVTFTLGEADGLRDVVITAMDKVNNVQKLEFLDVLITSKKEVITTIENEKAVADTEDNIVKPVAGAGIVLPSYDEDDSLLYMVIEVMSAAVLITAVVTFYRKKRKIRK